MLLLNGARFVECQCAGRIQFHIILRVIYMLAHVLAGALITAIFLFSYCLHVDVVHYKYDDTKYLSNTSLTAYL